MSWGRLSAENYRGARLPTVLGVMVLAPGAAAGAAVTAILQGDRGVAAGGWAGLVASTLVFAAGLIDDVVPRGPRGLRGHLRALAEGHFTTGALKLVVTVAVSIVVVVTLPRRGIAVELAGIVTIAAATNVLNGLDVAPGRALKAFLAAAVAILLGGLATRLVPGLTGLTAAAIVALPLDLGERAMLGDGGSNLLGFTAGLGLYVVLPGWGVITAALLGLALNVAADTVTLSRMIDALPPLRWVDRLGRRPLDA